MAWNLQFCFLTEAIINLKLKELYLKVIAGGFDMKTIKNIALLMPFLFLNFFLFFSSVYAKTILVASYGDGTSSLTNVQAAYDDASEGDTILLPENGSATWSSSFTIKKAITINGNGTTLTADAALANGFFYITNVTINDLIRITGFTLNAGVDYWSKPSRCIRIYNSVSLGSLRIDHNTFYYGYDSIEVSGSFGVIDNNYFYNGCRMIIFTAGSREQADESWEDMSAGTANALFIEDNYFIIDKNWPANYTQENIGSNNGGKLVIRYNDFDSDDMPDATVANSTHDPIHLHGSAAGGQGTAGYWQECSSCRRGQSVVEIYENTAHGKDIVRFYSARGSANLVYNNTITASTTTPKIATLDEEEYDALDNSNWQIKREEWPAEDQVHNTFFWGNTVNGRAQSSSDVLSYTSLSNANCTAENSPYSCCEGSGTGHCDFIQEDRDYFLHEPQADGGREIFTGKNGASGSYPTDGSTYSNLGTMVFTSEGSNAYYGYEAYTYPHPLRSEVMEKPGVPLNAGTR